MMSNIPIVAYAGLSFAWTATVVIAQAVAETGSVAILTQLGVFAVCGAIAWWFLKRESADRKDRAAIELTEREQLRTDLTSERDSHEETRKLLLAALVAQSTHAQLKVVPLEDS